ncbi:unnamed protein product [Rotaria sp. Silwood2]|nr:unnamed protein product [Rotaria sp. Silwood2]
MTLAGLLNDILSVIKFNSEVLRQTACYIYLLSSSINTSIMIIVFALKFLILIIAQMTYIKNRLFLYVQCRSLDFLLRIGLNMDQWLSVCVAIERTIIHEHLIFVPIALVILAIPRFIISLVSGCMKSSRDSWLFLTRYFIYFIPPILTFAVFTSN